MVCPRPAGSRFYWPLLAVAALLLLVLGGAPPGEVAAQTSPLATPAAPAVGVPSSATSPVSPLAPMPAVTSTLAQIRPPMVAPTDDPQALSLRASSPSLTHMAGLVVFILLGLSGVLVLARR